jgi:hypothetical protein
MPKAGVGKSVKLLFWVLHDDFSTRRSQKLQANPVAGARIESPSTFSKYQHASLPDV